MSAVPPGPPIQIGCSGWEYPEWVGPFYPRGTRSDHLRTYAASFPIVEINTSFYQIPSPRVVGTWARRTPRGFGFTAKLPQEITHVRRLEHIEEPLARFLEAMAPLRMAEKLRALLVQLPPSLPFDAPKVRDFYERLPEDVPVAVEFREPGWRDPASWDLLREFGFASTIVDEPLLPVDLTRTAPWVYVRWHGHGQPVWYDYRYSRAELQAWVPRIRGVVEGGTKALGFFNNHFRGDAPRNAREFQDLLGLLPPPWTPRLDREGPPSSSP